jgi:hypothetical protein
LGLKALRRESEYVGAASTEDSVAATASARTRRLGERVMVVEREGEPGMDERRGCSGRCFGGTKYGFALKV